MLEGKKENISPIEQKNKICRQQVLDSLERIGFSESLLEEEVISRLILLERDSKFNEDSRKIEQGINNILSLLEERYASEHPEFRLTKEQRIDAMIAAILHDIGKSGPVEASLQEQEVIVKIFSLEEIKNQDALLIDVISLFPKKWNIEQVVQSLEKCGIDAETTTMRQFWDKHAMWTHDILERHSRGLNKHVRIIAGSHHINRGINPYDLPESKIPILAGTIGVLEEYVETLEGRILMVADQYEAAIRRGKLTHEEALSWVKNNLTSFNNDPLMELIFDAIDELGKQEKIFEEIKY